jgi:hypothetical protein
MEGKCLLGAGRTLRGVKKSGFDTDKGYDASLLDSIHQHLITEGHAYKHDTNAVQEYQSVTESRGTRMGHLTTVRNALQLRSG